MSKKETEGFDGPIRPRKRDYSYQNDGGVASGVPDGDKTIKPGSPVEIIRPAFKGGRTVFRPLPSFVDEDKREVEPCRFSLEPRALSDWTRTYQVARYVGFDTKYTFILYRPTRNYERNRNPYIVLQKAISQAVNTGDAHIENSWLPLVNGREKKLSKPTSMTFMQGFVFEHNKKVFLGRELSPKVTGKRDLTPVIQLTASVTEKFQEAVDEVKKGYRGDPNNIEEAMVNGDIVSPKYGRFLSVFNPDEVQAGAIPTADSGDEQEVSWDAGGSNKNNNGNQFGKGFDLEILTKYHPPKGKGFISPSLVDKMDTVRKRVLFWDDILYFPSHEEICVLIATAFKSFPKLIQFGWSDYPEFFTDEIKGILKRRTQAQSAVPQNEEPEDLSGADEMNWGGTVDDEEDTTPTPSDNTVPNLRNADVDDDYDDDSVPAAVEGDELSFDETDVQDFGLDVEVEEERPAKAKPRARK